MNKYIFFIILSSMSLKAMHQSTMSLAMRIKVLESRQSEMLECLQEQSQLIDRMQEDINGTQTATEQVLIKIDRKFAEQQQKFLNLRHQLQLKTRMIATSDSGLYNISFEDTTTRKPYIEDIEAYDTCSQE